MFQLATFNPSGLTEGVTPTQPDSRTAERERAIRDFMGGVPVDGCGPADGGSALGRGRSQGRSRSGASRYPIRSILATGSSRLGEPSLPPNQLFQASQCDRSLTAW